MKQPEQTQYDNKFQYVDITTESIFIFDNNACITLNKAAREEFGYDIQDVKGRSGTLWIFPDCPQKEKLINIANTGEPTEITALRKDESTFTCELVVKNIEQNGKTYLAFVLKNIAEQKRVEHALTEKIRELEVITSSIPNSIWKARIDANGKISETYISGSINQLLELPQGTIKNDWEQFFSYVYKADLPGLRAKIAEGTQYPGINLSHEYRVRKGNGELAWLYSVGKTYQSGDKILGYGFTWDITQKKAQEEKLKDLNVTKDKFFSIISHDLRNPFTAFMGFSELMIRQIDQNRYTNLRKYARAIYTTARQGSELLSNLLEWSRSQRGKLQLRPEMVNLSELIHSIVHFYSETARSKEIEIEWKLSSDLQIRADRNMLETVLRNLISNAIKFSYRNQTVEIIIERAEGRTNFKVRDYGTGIDDDPENLFRIDKNIVHTGTEEEKGTGLGLILCREFVEKHGGEIKAENKDNSGAEFSFYIPDGL